MRSRATLPVLAATAIAIAGCGDAVGTEDALTTSEVAELSESMVQSSFDVTGEVAVDGATTTTEGTPPLADVPLTSTFEFTLTRTCLLGGQVVLAGVREREWDPEARTGFSDLSATRTHQSCARPFQGSDVVITLEGAPNIAVEAHHEWAEGTRHGLQTLSLVGAVDWSTSDGRSGTCEIDVQAAFDPDTHTRTVVGTFCNRSFDRTTTWHHDGMGGGGGMGG